jgi:CRP/FNR family cyclic AMP-dependent transcriptional regulator
MATVNIFKNYQQFESFPAGHTIFQEGQPGDLMYVVKEGEVDIFIHGQHVETVGPGGVVGEMALIDHTARSATAIAKTDCQLVPLDENRFNIFVHQVPFFSIQVMRVMADRLRHMNTHIN